MRKARRYTPVDAPAFKVTDNALFGVSLHGLTHQEATRRAELYAMFWGFVVVGPLGLGLLCAACTLVNRYYGR